MACNTEKYTRNKVLEVCNEMNYNWYAIKFVARDKDVWCTYEFVPDDENSSHDFFAILRLLNKALDQLVEKLG